MKSLASLCLCGKNGINSKYHLISIPFFREDVKFARLYWNMPKEIYTLDKLMPGEWGIVVSFNDEENGLKLMEMGCTPGQKIKMDSIAPLGDPVAVIVSGYKLSMRKDEAATINVECDK
ncbi:MAG: FeoA family protein [Bacteroidia bacterium]